MAHFAQINSSNVVTNVVVVANNELNNLPFPQSEVIGIQFCKGLLGENTAWVQTSYNGSFRLNYASEGCYYDQALDVFIPPQPYSSWNLDENTFQWVSPVPYPNDGKEYVWDEGTVSWIETAY